METSPWHYIYTNLEVVQQKLPSLYHGQKSWPRDSQAGHSSWACFVGPQSILKNILISCQI